MALGRVEGRVAGEHGGLEAAQLRARLQAQLLDEHVAGPLVGAHRVGLTARTVERQHQLRPTTARAAGARATNDSSSPTSTP